MPIVKKDETTKGLSLRVQLPNTKCAIQCMDEKFEESKNSGNFHIHRSWQVINAPLVNVNGDFIDINGVELEQYLTTKWSDGKGGFLAVTDTKVKKGLGRVYENFEILKIELPELDTDNPSLVCKGFVADAVIGSQAQDLRDAPTPEQIAKGQKVGDVRKDENGKPIQIFRPNISYFTGPSEVAPIAMSN